METQNNQNTGTKSLDLKNGTRQNGTLKNGADKKQKNRKLKPTELHQCTSQIKQTNKIANKQNRTTKLNTYKTQEGENQQTWGAHHFLALKNHKEPQATGPANPNLCPRLLRRFPRQGLQELRALTAFHRKNRGAPNFAGRNWDVPKNIVWGFFWVCRQFPGASACFVIQKGKPPEHGTVRENPLAPRTAQPLWLTLKEQAEHVIAKKWRNTAMD